MKKKTNKNSFWKALFNSRMRLLAYFSALILYLLIPSQGYYETLKLEKSESKVRASDFDIDFSYYPKYRGTQKVPNLTAESVSIIDVDSAVPIWEKNPEMSFRPASITKLMTALVALETYDQKQVLTVKNLNPSKDEADMGLAVGDELLVENLLYGLLIPSGNDAAYTLADNYPTGLSGFVARMNQKAEELSMKFTHFDNPSGLDSPTHISTARDLSILAREAIKNPTIAKIVTIKASTVPDVSGKKQYSLKNVNQLLGVVSGVDGIKTGFTDLAGQCLISSVTRNGHRVIFVVLNSNDRFGESEKIINWVFNNYEWVEFVPMENYE